MGKRNYGEFKDQTAPNIADEWDRVLMVETAEKIANSSRRCSVLTGLIRLKSRLQFLEFRIEDGQNRTDPAYQSLFLQPGSEFI